MPRILLNDGWEPETEANWKGESGPQLETGVP
jgi:hypothetical protein